MAVIDDGRVQSLLKQLDDDIPREGHVELFTNDEADSTLLRANKLGYLRLGVEFLKAAYAPSTHGQSREWVEVDLGYLTGLERHCYSFERREDVWSPVHEESTNPASGIVGGLIGLFLLACIVIGAFTMFRWVSGMFF